MLLCVPKIDAAYVTLALFVSTSLCGFLQTVDAHQVEFLSEPSTVMVNRDRRAVFRCSASPPGVRIEWLQNGHPLQEDSVGIVRIAGNKLIVKLRPNISHESFPAKTPEHINLMVAHGRHQIMCLARFKGQAIISQPAIIMFAELSPFSNHADIHLSVIKGNTAAINCSPPHSVPAALTEFTFKGHKIDLSKDKYIHLPSGNLQILNTQMSDTGTYQCSAHNPFLNERKTAKYKVHLHVVESQHPKAANFTWIPKSVPWAAVMGSNVTLECLSEGYPVPNIVWHRKGGHLPHHRHQILAGNLALLSVRRSDEGTYVCRAQNRHGKISFETNLKVLEIPHILQPPESQQAMEGDSVGFHCITDGRPHPEVTWYHNGVKIHDNLHIIINGSSVSIRKVKNHHEGIYQCFATNELGSVHASGLLTINSEDTQPSNISEIGNDYYGDPEFSDDEEDPDDVTGNRKWRKHKGVIMVPPTHPEVTRLSDDSVMVRWSIPHKGGLPINFFKVQYQEFERNKGGPWNTIDEDIAAHIYSYSVTQLKPGGKYRFRIAAVYSNNDNRTGPKSSKFTLSKNPLLKRPRFAPVIMYAEPPSPSAITITWEFRDTDSTPIQGFFIYYRATASAGDYIKTTVLGANTQAHTVSHLLPQTSYDLKMQSFSPAGTSDFSNIYTCKTQGGSDPLDPKEHSDPELIGSKEHPYSSKESTGDSASRHVTLGIILGVLGILVLVVLTWVLIRKYRQPVERVSAPHASSNAKNLCSNGFTQNGFLDPSKINIQVNPLSESEASKTLESPYSLIEYQEEPSNNNNEVILLSTLQRNRKNSTGV